MATLLVSPRLSEGLIVKDVVSVVSVLEDGGTLLYCGEVGDDV